MRKARAAWLVLAAAALAGAPAPARGGIGEGNGEIGAGYALARIDSDLIGDTGGRVSLWAGRHTTDVLQWEGHLSRARVEEDGLPGAGRSVEITLAMANAIVNFHPRRRVVPYVLGGIGLAKTDLEAVGLRSHDTQSGLQIGGGVRIFPGERNPVGIRIEASILWTEAFEETYTHPTVGAGVTFRLGRAPGPGAPRP